LFSCYVINCNRLLGDSRLQFLKIGTSSECSCDLHLGDSRLQ
jgi:hypothetical protein